MPTIRIDKNLKDRSYFMTFTAINWIDIFTSRDYFEVVINVLKFYQRKLSLKVFGYVIMTNHMHLIAQCRDMISFIRGFKSYTTNEIIKLVSKDNRKYTKKLIDEYNELRNKVYQIWDPRNWPKICEEEDYFEQKLNYIHENPVVKGYVDKPEEWLYSSARNYYNNDNSVIRVNTECDLD